MLIEQEVSGDIEELTGLFKHSPGIRASHSEDTMKTEPWG